MWIIDLPAGSTVRLTATARPDAGIHRWSVKVFAADDGDAGAASRAVYGAGIGGKDLRQLVDIPAQDTDCRLEVRSEHTAGDDWGDDRCVVDTRRLGAIKLGFFDPNATGAAMDDVSLSFVIRADWR